MDAVVEGEVRFDDLCGSTMIVSTRPRNRKRGKEKGGTNLIKSSWLSNVVYHSVCHFAADGVDHIGGIGDGGEDPLAFDLGAGGYYDVEAAFEEVIEDMRGDEAGAACCRYC